MTKIIMTTPDELEYLVRTVLRQELGNTVSTQIDEKKYLTINEAAKFLAIPQSTLYQFTSQRVIPFTKSGRRLMFLRVELEEWLVSRRKGTRQEIENQLRSSKTGRK